MYAQGIIIDPVSPTTWSYVPDVQWPAARSRDFTTWVTNRGNLQGTATITPPPGAETVFSMPSVLVNANGAQTALVSTFGGAAFNNCNTVSGSYTATGTVLAIEASGLAGATQQVLGSAKGICQAQASVGAWTESLTLVGQVSRVASMCATGQVCSAGGSCICTTALDSCGLIGCCAGDGTCVPYASQTTRLSSTNPGIPGCGQAGSACAQCPDTSAAATCSMGVCSCGASSTKCSDDLCYNLSTDPDNCGGCGVVCSTNNVVEADPQHPLCVNGQCAGQCVAGWGNCGGTKQADGCNVHLNTTDRCGSCTTSCGAGQRCTDTDPGPAEAWSCGCDATTCPNGCCRQGVCVLQQDATKCGRQGNECTTCDSGQACTAVTGGGQCQCTTSSCSDGCCDSNTCYPGTAPQYCGTGGGACAPLRRGPALFGIVT